MKKLFLFLSLLCSLSLFGQQDIPVVMRASNANLFRSVAWNSTGYVTPLSPGLNNNFVISLPTPDSGVCLALTNLDSIVHTFTVGAFVTSDPQLTTFTGNLNPWIPVVNTSGAIAKLVKGNTQGSTFTQFFKYAGAVRMVIQIAGGSGAGLASATVTLNTQGGCGTTPFLNVVGTSEWTSAAITNGSAYSATACVTNPGIGANILTISWSNAVARSRVFFHSGRATTSAAGQINLSAVTTAGTTCTTPASVQSPLVNGAATNAATITSACTGLPTVTGEVANDQFAAGVPGVYDLQGFWISSSTIQGLEFRTPAAITGVVCGTFQWSELP